MKAKGTTEVAERVGAIVPASPGSSAVVAKMLRTATVADGSSLGLWPAPGKGVRHAAFTSTHLVNLFLALGCGSPVDAVAIVELFRGLRPDQETREARTRIIEGGNRLMTPFDFQATFTETVIKHEAVLPANTFGEALDTLVEWLADPEMTSTLRNTIRNSRVLITIEPRPMAEIVIQFDGTDRPKWKTTFRPTEQPDLLMENSPSSPTSELQRVFYGAAFEALATIWNGTRATSGLGLFQNGGQSKIPAKKNAAPGRAAPSNSSLQADPQKDAAPQKSSLDTCDHTARARVSSRGFDRKAGQLEPRSRSHVRTSDHHALFPA